MSPEKFNILIEGLFKLLSALIAAFTILKMFQDYNKRIIDVAKEKSTGATALAKVINDIQAHSGRLTDLEIKRKESENQINAIDRKLDTQLQNYHNILQQLMAQFSAFFNK